MLIPVCVSVSQGPSINDYTTNAFLEWTNSGPRKKEVAAEKKLAKTENRGQVEHFVLVCQTKYAVTDIVCLSMSVVARIFKEECRNCVAAGLDPRGAR